MDLFEVQTLHAPARPAMIISIGSDLHPGAGASNFDMQIENLPPNKPNFGLIVALSGVGLLVFFVLAYLFLHRDHVAPGRYNKHPVSRLVLPGLPAPGMARPPAPPQLKGQLSAA